MGDTQGGAGFSLQDIIGAMSRMAGGQSPQPRTEPPMNAPGRAAGLKAVEGATTGRQEPTVSGETARAAGLSAVDKEMDAANTEAWKAKMAGRKADRARAGSEGKAAVADALKPADVRAMIQARAQQPSWASPEESAGWAQTLGQVGVEGALHTPNNPPGFSPPANTDRPTTVTRGPNAHLLTPEQEASVQDIMRQNQGAAEGDEIHHDMTLVDEFLARGHPDYQPVPAGDPRLPMIPPGMTFGPQEVTTPDMAGAAPRSMRAVKAGRSAVERELDKEPE
jgi:hypothetical protein